ncbi:LysR family transcriptional regulator [Sandaracinus amylolyticus]|uniref:LysR family transcriptional regulator n=1 Tax=Sandaracinus amylolyticus TaxID=927083 RepID=UPI001F1B9BF5|nr:LysR family transcriptional regulator [Sandaracinus amylolyticus]UJR85284.1 Hypothetical protein I5071_73640 [Sandaracinus amylolyticus]
MSVPDLQAFVAVATHRSFRAAATELGVSPSALSHTIATLEQRLGVRLLHRTTRSVSLTDAGAHLLARIGPPLREIAGALESVDDFRDTPRGTLRITTSRGAARYVLMPIVLEFRRRFPEVQVDLVTEERLVDIVAEGLDAGVRVRDLVPKDMVAIPCGPQRVGFAIVGAPSYFEGRTRPRKPGDLLEHECIRFRMPSGTIYRWELEKRGKEVVLDVQGALTLGDEELVRRAALDGAGLAYLSDWAVHEDLAARRLVRVLAGWTPDSSGLALFHPSHRYVSASLRAFIGVMRELAPR